MAGKTIHFYLSLMWNKFCFTAHKVWEKSIHLFYYSYTPASVLTFYIFLFGLYTTDKEASDFSKVLDSIISEIQGVLSASFLSFWEILYYMY